MTEGGPPPNPVAAGSRAELDDAPPFLSWRAIYLLVLGALAIEVVLGAALTAAVR